MTNGSHRPRQTDVHFAHQIDLAATLAPLGRAGDDLLDRWDGRVLARTAIVAGVAVPYVARPLAGRPGPSVGLAVVFPAAGPNPAEVARLVLSTLVLELPALSGLAERDEPVARLMRAYPGVVPVLFRDPFAALIRSISAQQVNLRWAATVRHRLAERYGERHPIDDRFVYRLDAAKLARAAVPELRALQLTNAKARSVIACAQAAQAGELQFAQLERAADEEVIAHLTGLRGIGRWSAEWFLARTLGRPRVVAGDLGVRKAVGRLYGQAQLPSENEVRRLTEHWRSAATLAQTLALHALALSELPPPPPAG